VNPVLAAKLKTLQSNNELKPLNLGPAPLGGFRSQLHIALCHGGVRHGF
jgi:hypothetical protein